MHRAERDFHTIRAFLKGTMKLPSDINPIDSIDLAVFFIQIHSRWSSKNVLNECSLISDLKVSQQQIVLSPSSSLTCFDANAIFEKNKYLHSYSQF